MLRSCCDEPWGLKHIDILFEDPVKKCCENVQLMYWPVQMNSDGDESPNGLPEDYRCKGFDEVDAIDLFESPGH